nr:EpsG family protein [uncultured Blautia sp.]
MIVSSCVYIICLIAYLTGMNEDKRKNFESLILVVVFLLAFFHKPLLTDDLTREYEKLSQIKNMGWSFFNTNYSFQENSLLGRITSNGFEGLYVTQLLYFLFSKLPVFNFLPACVTSFQFFLCFKLLNKARKRFSLSYYQEILLFLSFMFVRELRWMMSGIRNQLAFTIAIYIVYNDLEEKKNKILCIIGYILCGMIHQSAYVVLFLRVLLLIPSKKIKAIIAVLLLGWSTMLSTIVQIMSKYINIPVINSILWKITIYTDNSKDNINIILRDYYKKVMISNSMLLVVAFVFCIIGIRYIRKFAPGQYNCYMLGRYGNKNINISENLSENYVYICLYAVCLTIGSYMYYWLFLRFAVLVQLMLPVLAAYIFSVKNRSYRSAQVEKIFLFFAIMLKFVIMVLVVNASFDFSLFSLYS